MRELRHSRLLIPVMTLTVLAGVALNIVFQTGAEEHYPFWGTAGLCILSLIVQIGIISIIWSIALKSPKVGGIAILLLFGLIAFSAIPAYFDGRMSQGGNPVVLALLITLAVLYAAGGVMLMFSKKVAVSESTERLDSSGNSSGTN
jgi:hypothetical protein